MGEYAWLIKIMSIVFEFGSGTGRDSKGGICKFVLGSLSVLNYTARTFRKSDSLYGF